jgi:hypothetical protein
MTRDLQIVVAMALAAAAVIWFLEQRNTQTSATQGTTNLNSSSAGSP